MAVNRRKARHRAPPGGKFLLVGPDWNGQKPEGFGFAFHHLLLPALSLQRCVLLAQSGHPDRLNQCPLLGE
jgi:hypothetical protein